MLITSLSQCVIADIYGIRPSATCQRLAWLYKRYITRKPYGKESESYREDVRHEKEIAKALGYDVYAWMKYWRKHYSPVKAYRNFRIPPVGKIRNLTELNVPSADVLLYKRPKTRESTKIASDVKIEEAGKKFALHQFNLAMAGKI